jgi:hypothetical protein
MMLLTKRQELAKSLTRELGQLGANVTNVLPLADDQNLKFWCSDYKKGQILTALSDWGFEVTFKGMSPQVCRDTYSMGLVNNFEIALEREQTPIVDDRTIPRGELAQPKKHDHERFETLKSLGYNIKGFK